MLLVGIGARFHRIDDGLIDDQLSVVTDVNLEAIHRARRGAFEIEAADVIAGAVARALEFFFGLEPSRGASEVRAFREDRVEAGLGADNPDAETLAVPQ